jgi:hypothetical protein
MVYMVRGVCMMAISPLDVEFNLRKLVYATVRLGSRKNDKK